MHPGSVLRRWLDAALALRERAIFAIVFTALAVDTAIVGIRHPLGPGLDQHYHVLNASIAARGWLGDKGIRALYATVNPFDANTFVYTWTLPFQLFFDPVRAYGVAFTLLYFVGFPLACAVSLHLMRRPLWGALLAFPLSYTNTWVKAGYIPFVSAAPFFVLAIGLMHRFLEEDTLDRPVTTAVERASPSKKRILLTIFVPVFALLAHAQGYLWLATVLGLLTILSLGRDLVVGLPFAPKKTLVHGVKKGLTALTLILPSLLLFVRWYWPSLRATAEAPPIPPSATPQWQAKLTFLYASLVSVKDDDDWGWAVAVFGLVVLLVLLLGRPRGRALPSPEIALGASLASFWLLPEYVNGQSIGLRQIDFVCWLLPLVVYAAPVSAGQRVRGVAAVVLLTAFATMRTAYLAPFRAKLHREYAGITGLGCPPRPPPGAPPAEIAYVTFGQYSEHWHAASLQQAHESYAAFCRMDTPVYDPGKYAFSLPVHYRKQLPAPITIIADDPRWFMRPNLFTSFEYVLVRGWRPLVHDLKDARERADEVKTFGEWALWRRKAASPPEALAP